MANNYVLIGGFARHDFVIRKSLIVTIYNDLSGTNDFGAVPKQASFPKWMSTKWRLANHIVQNHLGIALWNMF